EAVSIPVFLSSLLQIPFIQSTLPAGAEIGVLTANSDSLTPEVFNKIGLNDVAGLVIRGLQHEKHFKDAVVDEIGTLDSDGIRAEVVQAAKEMTSDHPEIRSLLLECSMMPPYSEAVQQETGLPVYDFLTMIDFVYTAVVKKHFADVM
ncbi:MAG: aspartate/glutamate racemase family protein, partial [Desulfobacterales bacterium]|nr:aspartate/glutamate racemase family protein [Desulfobacterales bacterium]